MFFLRFPMIFGSKTSKIFKYFHLMAHNLHYVFLGVLQHYVQHLQSSMYCLKFKKKKIQLKTFDVFNVLFQHPYYYLFSFYLSLLVIFFFFFFNKQLSFLVLSRCDFIVDKIEVIFKLKHIDLNF